MPGEPNIESGDGLIRTFDLLETLNNDVYLAFKLLENDKQSQFLRRNVIRIVFSYIEAIVESIKVEIRSSIRLNKPNFELSDKEKDLLGSLDYFSDAKVRQFPFEQNLKLTFKLASKVWGLDFRLNTDGEDYRDFVISKSYRNKLVHPKTVYDIEITDDDMHYHSIACMWVEAEFKRLIEARLDSLGFKVK